MHQCRIDPDPMWDLDEVWEQREWLRRRRMLPPLGASAYEYSALPKPTLKLRRLTTLPTTGMATATGEPRPRLTAPSSVPALE